MAGNDRGADGSAETIKAYVEAEVLPHAPGAWVDEKKIKVGYEIPFTRHFYTYVPPRPLQEIDADLNTLVAEIYARNARVVTTYLGMDRPFVSGGVRIASITPEDLPALLLQRVMRMRPTGEADLGYLRYLEPLFTGVSVPHISEWQVRKFRLPVTPPDEQRAIAANLDEQTATIDALIARTERFIELAKERRAALITAAVTGQLDGRRAA